MRLQTVFSACNHILKAKLKSNPEAKTYTESGEVVKCKELSEELENLESWCYQNELEVKKVVRCKNCKHYRTYKNRGSKQVFFACALERKKREPEFFCAKGEER